MLSDKWPDELCIVQSIASENGVSQDLGRDCEVGVEEMSRSERRGRKGSGTGLECEAR